MPRATELAAIVAVRVPLPKFVSSTEPVRSPAKVMVGDLFIVVSELMSPPFISGVFSTGEVRVLLVNVAVV